MGENLWLVKSALKYLRRFGHLPPATAKKDDSHGYAAWRYIKKYFRKYSRKGGLVPRGKSKTLCTHYISLKGAVMKRKNKGEPFSVVDRAVHSLLDEAEKQGCSSSVDRTRQAHKLIARGGAGAGDSDTSDSSSSSGSTSGEDEEGDEEEEEEEEEQEGGDEDEDADAPESDSDSSSSSDDGTAAEAERSAMKVMKKLERGGEWLYSGDCFRGEEGRCTGQSQ